MLDGRDGSSLKEWLKSNKHVRTVTRDRASAYAKAIKEEIPDAKQIADRFHQHQNFLQVIKKCINTSFPQTIRIENKDNKHETCTEISSKKSLFDVDNLTDYQRKRYELLTNIQKWLHQILVIKILL